MLFWVVPNKPFVQRLLYSTAAFTALPLPTCVLLLPARVLLLPCRFNGKAWLKFEDENGLWGIATVSSACS
jgi:hypothetical protein